MALISAFETESSSEFFSRHPWSSRRPNSETLAAGQHLVPLVDLAPHLLQSLDIATDLFDLPGGEMACAAANARVDDEQMRFEFRLALGR